MQVPLNLFIAGERPSRSLTIWQGRTLAVHSILMFLLFLVTVSTGTVSLQAQTSPAPVTVIKAGRLIDPETGTAATNQLIIVEGEKIKAVGWNVAIPSGATVIDLSN